MSDCCRYAECIGHEYHIYLSVQNRRKGHDLVFGNHRQFASEDLDFYSVKGCDLTYYPLKLIEFRSNMAYSANCINFHSYQPEKFFIPIQGNVSDTLRLQNRKYDSKCCGNGITIEKINTGSNEYD